MRDLASIERIKKLEPLEGKDKIELATINDWEVIVEKGQFNVGDLVVYIEYDTVLPEIKEFEFLRSRCWSKTYQGFRIRNMKMAGAYSQGIVFSTSILKDKVSIKEGVGVAKELGIVRYAPQEKKAEKNIRNPFFRFLMKFKIIRFFVLHKKSTIEYPSTVAKSDETNIQKNFNILSNHHGLFYRSEKLEGQSATFMRLKNKYLFFSHNCYRDDKTPSTWKTISDKYNMKELLMKYPEPIAVQGEIIGEGIQGNIYGLKGIDFYVFKITNTDTGIAYSLEEMENFCNTMGLNIVPILERNVTPLSSAKEMLEDSDGVSIINPRVKREGIVWRSMIDANVGCKAKSVKYAIWFAKKFDKTV